MTVSSVVRSVTFNGNGVASVFAFPFKVFQPADLLVTSQDMVSGITTTLSLTTDYSVALNANQDVAPGGLDYARCRPAGNRADADHHLGHPDHAADRIS